MRLSYKNCHGRTFHSRGRSHPIAEQFHIKVWPTRPGLVPFTLQPPDKQKFSDLPGISVFKAIAQSLHHWQLKPGGTEGYRTEG